MCFKGNSYGKSRFKTIFKGGCQRQKPSNRKTYYRSFSASVFQEWWFVRPEWFKPIQETKRGFVYGIVPPRKGRLNLLEVHEAEDAKANLEAYISRLTAVCNVLDNKKCATKEAIDEALPLIADLQVGQITFERIEEARKTKEEDEAKRAIKDKSFFAIMELFLQKKQFSYDQTKGYRVLM